MHPKTLEGQVRSGAGQDPLSSGNYAKLRIKCTEMKSYPGLLPKDWSEFDVRCERSGKLERIDPPATPDSRGGRPGGDP
jgi:hypothetical protein